MSLTELVYRAYVMVPFDPQPPTAPSAAAQTAAGSLWGTVGWILAAVAAFALAGACFMFFSHKSNGQSNEGVVRAGWILGGCLGFGMVLGIVGTVTGT